MTNDDRPSASSRRSAFSQEPGIRPKGGPDGMQKLLALIYIDVPALRPGTVGAYLLAFGSVGITTALRVAVDPYVGGVQFITFYPAVIMTTLIGGLGAGLFCVVLSVAAAVFFVLPPHFSLYVQDPSNLLLLLLFILVTLSNVILITGMRFAIERKRDEQALQASKDRLQFALDTALLGWWQYDPRRRAILVDTRFKEIFDVTADEIPVEKIKKLVHPDDAERFGADHQASLDPGNPKRSPHEYRVQRRGGEVRWVEVHWLAHFDVARHEPGTTSVVGVVQDITERKEREEREHFLVREVNHRAKNMLSLVQAIARQTAAREPEDFIERFTKRIQALAANQNLLVRNEWQGVDVEDLVYAQLAHFAGLVGSRITVHGSPLRLNAAAAQAIGLALHELATNAGKYGALSVDAGRVDVGWGLDGDIFAMDWTESKRPPVSQPKRRGV